MKNISKTLGILIMAVLLSNALLSPAQADPGIGDQVHQITVPESGVETFCSIGLAFDGDFLYYDRCGDENIYMINPISGDLINTFDTDIAELPNALAYDRTRNGIWIGTQACNAQGMPIYFWDRDDNSVTHAFTVPFNLINPATGQSFLRFCFTDGLAFDANDPTDPDDDELWFNDDVNPNIGIFRPNGGFLRGYDARTIDPSLNTSSGLAIGGQFIYIANNGGGDIFRADKTTTPLTIVDQFTSGDTRQEDMECDPTTFAPIEVMWVRTTPQGGQFPDVITAYEIEQGSCGQGGAPIDSDGDGLYDDWETEGVTIDPDGVGPLSAQFIDLPAMRANKDVPDIFVHVDWMFDNDHNHRLQAEAIRLVVDAFAKRNIRLHVDQGPDSILDYSTGETWGGLSRAGSFPEVFALDPAGSLDSFSWDGFQALKDRPNGFKDAGRTPVFHYVISAHQLFTIIGPAGDPCGPSGVSRGAPASDFIIALGGWHIGANGRDDCDESPSANHVGTVEQQAGTFMHELGHNLGLGHGGGDGINNKPNYLSVMNYSFQMKGLRVADRSLKFDYSFSELPILDEKNLHENIGIQGGDQYSNYDTLYFCGSEMRIGDANGPINWNCSGGTTDAGLLLDINNDNKCVGSGENGVLNSSPMGDDVVEDDIILNGSNDICESTPSGDDVRMSSLAGYDDWANLVFDGGLIGLGESVVDLPMETSAQEITPFESILIPADVQRVEIDIKPGGDPNSISCKNTRGVIPVAILTTRDFDALTVDHATVSFEGASEVHLTRRGVPQRHESDVDGDGDIDLVLHFRLGSTSLSCDSTEGTLTGQTFEGLLVEGVDSVRMIR